MAKLFGSTHVPFADRKQLSANRSRFCILDANIKESNGRDQWFLDISRKAGDDVVLETLTFDRSEKRDAGFQSLKDSGQFPKHNCWLEKRQIKSKQKGMIDYYDLNVEEMDLPCACTTGGTSSGEDYPSSPDDDVPLPLDP